MGSSQYIVPASCGPPPVEQNKYCVLRTDALSNPNNFKKQFYKENPEPAPDTMASSAQYIQRPSAFEYGRLEKTDCQVPKPIYRFYCTPLGLGNLIHPIESWAQRTGSKATA